MEKDSLQNTSIRKTCHLLSKLFFINSLKLMRISQKKNLELEDLNGIETNYQSNNLGDELEKMWQKHDNPPSILKVLWDCFGVQFILYGILQLFIDVSSVVILQPYLIGKIVSYFSKNQNSISKIESLSLVFSLILIFLLRVVYRSTFALTMAIFGIKIRTALSSLLYQKILNSHTFYVEEISSGQVFTTLTKDVQSVESFAVMGNDLWTTPVKIMVWSGILYFRLGIASVVGVGCFFLVMPIQWYLGNKVKTIRTKMCNYSDKRLQITQEIVTGIRQINLNNWQKFYKDQIEKARKEEIRTVCKMLMVKFILTTVGSINSDTALYLMLMTYIWCGNLITGEIIYYLLIVFSNMYFAIAIVFPNAIYKLSELISATKRIDNVLKNLKPSKDDQKENGKSEIILEDVTVTKHNQIIFSNITLNMDKGLTIIHGPVGSGKTTLIKTILQQQFPLEGLVKVTGKVSYAPQEPWLFPGTIKENILFGKEYNCERYQEVIRVCALTFDFNLLKNGDATIVEDKGANLSKGQQARINLARAVYSDSDICLLDNSLDSLDSSIGFYIYNECLKKFLKDKIVILITQNMRYCQSNNKVLILENRTINEQQSSSRTSIVSCNTINEFCEEETSEENEETKLINVYQENKKSGKVLLKTYQEYCSLGGGKIITLILFAVIASTTIFHTYKNKFLSDWVNKEETISQELNKTDKNLQILHENMTITYSIISTLLIIFFIAKAICVLYFGRAVSIKLHSKMITQILYAHISFFDKNFLGSILNRFSKDITTVDETIPFLIHDSVWQFFTLLGSIVLIVYANASFLIPIGFLFVVMIFFRQYSLKCTTTLKRLDVITRSPIVGHLSATLEGLITIKAFNAEDMFRQEFDLRQNSYFTTSYAFESCAKAFTFVLDGMSVLFNTSIIFSFFVLNDKPEAGLVGLAISQAYTFTTVLNVAITKWTEMDNQMISFERALEYCGIKAANLQKTEKPNWPEYGKIVFENVSLSYDDTQESILKNINCTISAKDKIAIVGRTGVGKSSIISALLRFYEITGQILIDDINIKHLGIEFLRSKISVVPQEPIIFSGTIRNNLDPFGQATDDKIWSALNSAMLNGVVTDLNLQVGNGGIELSFVQKQLLCIARAIIQQNTILILDEVTANTDANTTEKIHKIIKENFDECTVLTITHKLDNISTYDKIMVLKDGSLDEFDTPENLKKNKNLK